MVLRGVGMVNFRSLNWTGITSVRTETGAFVARNIDKVPPSGLRCLIVVPTAGRESVTCQKPRASWNTGRPSRVVFQERFSSPWIRMVSVVPSGWVTVTGYG